MRNAARRMSLAARADTLRVHTPSAHCAAPAASVLAASRASQKATPAKFTWPGPSTWSTARPMNTGPKRVNSTLSSAAVHASASWPR